MEINQIITGDCLEILRSGEILSNVDLVVTDPPYQFVNNVEPSGGGFIKEQKKQLVNEIRDNFGLDFDPTEMLETIRAGMKKFNGYFFTNRFTLPTYIKWIEKYNYKWDLLLWLKPNPMPIFKGHYLFDKEYCVYIHDSGTTWNADLGYQNYFTYESHPIGNRKYYSIKCLDQLNMSLYLNDKLLWKEDIDEKGTSQKNDMLELTNEKEQYLNILSYGKDIIEKYLNECKSTTKMGISKTTIYQILNCLHHLNIREGTHDAKKYDELYTSHVESAENGNLLIITIKEKTESAHDVKNAVWRMQLGIKEKERESSHPTQKPLEMIERLIKISSNEGDLVLDCYLGSGTTAVACKNTNRNFIGIEINPEYVQIAKNRLKETELMLQQRLF